jgi:choline kinase
MHAVILAAGDGGRLHALTSGSHKALLPIAGRRIIDYVLDALYDGGVTDATAVLGHCAGEVRAAIEARQPDGMHVRFVENEAFELGNARSLWAARHAVDGPFLLAMADHLIEPAMVQALTAGAADRCRLAVEMAHPADPRAAEATRALVRDGRVIDLGKQIRRWNALDTGLFWCTPRAFDVMTPDLRDGEAGAVFALLARAGELDAIDVTGALWCDIDTPDDARTAEALIARARSTDPPPRDEVA